MSSWLQLITVYVWPSALMQTLGSRIRSRRVGSRPFATPNCGEIMVTADETCRGRACHAHS